MKKVIIALIAFPLSVLADTTIFLDIEGPEGTLFKSEIMVAACVPDGGDETAVPEATGYCALKQSGLSTEWSAYGDDLFLSSISGIANDFGANKSWSWFSNLEFGQTSLLKHLLVPGEKLLVTYNKMPLGIEISSTSPAVHSTTTIAVKEFGFDSSWNPVWLPAENASVLIGPYSHIPDSSGNVDFVATTTDALLVRAQKAAFLDTDVVTLAPTTPQEDIPETTPDPVVPATGGTSELPSASLDASKAVAFISTLQKPNGSFGSLMYTDWVAIGLAAGPRTPAKGMVAEYFQSGDIKARDFSTATDFERHAMALLALDINPYSGTPINVIDKIVSFYDGTQIGDENLVNDDVFALFPLIKSGYSAEDEIIQNITKRIIAEQGSNGSWENSIDLTAAALQALNLVSERDGVSAAVSRAAQYLNATQQPDGGFGSVFSTAWVLQAGVLGQEQAKKAQHYLHDQQADDGGLMPASADEYTRLWATAYAIPAAQELGWASIMSSAKKPKIKVEKSIQRKNQDKKTQSATPSELATAAHGNPVSPIVVNAVAQPAVVNMPAQPTISASKIATISGDVPVRAATMQGDSDQLAALAEVIPENADGGRVALFGIGAIAILAAIAFIIRKNK